MVKKAMTDLFSSILYTREHGNNDRGYAEAWKLFVTRLLIKGRTQSLREHVLQICKISAHLTESREEYAKIKIIACWESEGWFSFLA